jgi:hypothetical protein
MTHQPHLVGVEEQLRERPGVMLVSLLTDEAGCLMMRRGEIPLYVLEQIERALEWAATDYRGVVSGERQTETTEARRSQKKSANES